MITINLIKNDPIVRVSASRRRWREKHPEKQRAAELRWRRDPRNAAKLKEKNRAQAGYVRERALRVLYGLSPEKLAALIAHQGGRCAICRDVLRGGRYQHVDHDHTKPGTARGVLCSECNTAIGKLREDPEVLERAALYLRKGGMR